MANLEPVQPFSGADCSALAATGVHLPLHEGCTCAYAALPWHGASYIFVVCGPEECPECLERAADVVQWIVEQGQRQPHAQMAAIADW